VVIVGAVVVAVAEKFTPVTFVAVKVTFWLAGEKE
jgi:uncharacterized membrane protein